MNSTIVRRTTAFGLSDVSWSQLMSEELTLPVNAGDWIEIGVSMLAPNNYLTGLHLDVQSVTSGRWLSTGDVTHSHGVPGWHVPVMSTWGNMSIGGSMLYKVQAGDISGGVITLRLYSRTNNSTAQVIASSTDRATFFALARTGTAGPLAPPATAFIGWGIPIGIVPGTTL